MTLDQLPARAHVFVDSNILVYHFQPHPGFGPMCHRLLERIERQDIEGSTSTHVLGELAHRLMVIEAGTLPGWAGGKVLNRLKQQPGAVQQLTLFQTAVEAVLQSRIRVLTIPASVVSTAATLRAFGNNEVGRPSEAVRTASEGRPTSLFPNAVSRQHGLLTTDAVILALMQAHRLSDLVSHDAHVDAVPGLRRYVPA